MNISSTLISYIKAVCVVVCIAFFPLFATAQESIPLFESTITLNEDGTFLVQERITYEVGGEERRGIYRFIPKDHPQDSGSPFTDRSIEIELIDISKDGEEVPYTVTDSNTEFEVRIGDPDVYITGQHTYEITYAVSGGYSYFDDGTAEIYWNVTGSEWEIPILQAIAHINDPYGLLIEPSYCYAGVVGSDVRCGSLATASQGVTFSEELLESGEGLTIAHAVDGARITFIHHERYNIFPFLLLITIIGLAWMGLYAYRHMTTHAHSRTIIAQYEPYRSFKPMYAGMIQDGRLDPRDITAGIVFLAQQGFLKITKTEDKVLLLFEVDDYIVELLRPIDSVSDSFSADVLELLFSKHASVGSSVRLRDLSKDVHKQHENSLLLQKIHKDIKADMHASGLLEKERGRYITPLWVCGALILVLLGASLYTPTALVLVGCVCVGLLIVSIAIYERKTREGYVAQNHIQGFKHFLSVTDSERFTFHNAPSKSPEQFMEYLPYAIAFGVEKEWAEVFKDITIPNPAWYSENGGGTFAPVSFAQSMHAFSSSVSSASSSSSGSGGGGSSGGGGGGGGGGGW